MKRQEGLTLLELLLALVLLGTLGGALMGVVSTSLRAGALIAVRQELLLDAQIVGSLLASRWQEASYLYPPGTAMQLTTSGETTRNTVGGSGQQWTVGDTFSAMILPPQRTGTCTAHNTAACFRFFAYYPMQRSAFVLNPNLASSGKPDPDPANDREVWMLLEYRGHFIEGVTRRGLLDAPPNPTTYPRGLQGRILLDYLQPARDYRLFNLDAAPTEIETNLRLERRIGRQTVTVPVRGASFSNRIYPRNLR